MNRKESKKRNTPQRLEIINYLSGNKNHPTAYEIYKNVKKKIPTISFATVYNNLKMMVKEKDIIEVIDGDKKRFDPDTTPHDHFFCINCGRVYDIPKVIDRVSYKDFKIISHITYLKGICDICLKKNKN